MKSLLLSVRILEDWDLAHPGRPEVATDLPLIGTGFTLQNIEVLKSDSDTPWVKVPFKKCNKVYTYSALLIDLGKYTKRWLDKETLLFNC